MLKDIIDYLYQFKDSKYYPINNLLLTKYPDYDIQEIRKGLVILTQSKRIEIQSSEHLNLGGNSKIKDTDATNVPRDLTNLEIYAKLTLEERERLDQIEASKPKVQPVLTEV